MHARFAFYFCAMERALFFIFHSFILHLLLLSSRLDSGGVIEPSMQILAQKYRVNKKICRV